MYITSFLVFPIFRLPDESIESVIHKCPEEKQTMEKCFAIFVRVLNILDEKIKKNV